MKLSIILLRFLMRKKRVIKGLAPQNLNHICVFSNTAIGDTLFNTPVFRELKKAYPKSKITAILNPKNASLFATNPNIDEILLYDGRWRGFFKILKELKKRKCQVALLLHSNEPQATPLAVFAGIEYIYKFPNDKNEFNFWHSNAPMGLEKLQYAVLNRLRVLEFLGIYTKNSRLELFLQNNDKKDALLWLQSLKNELCFKNGAFFIGFNLGASNLSRQWFIFRWVELALMLLKHENIVIILTGAPNEKKLALNFKQELLAKLEQKELIKRVCDASGEFSLNGAARLIGGLDLFISADTGPFHIAVALKTPSITLFAVAEPLASMPNYDENLHFFIKKPRTCAPCVGKNCKYQKCMLQISAQEVYELCKKWL